MNTLYDSDVFFLSEDFVEEIDDFEEEEANQDEPATTECVIMMPMADSGSYVYVCAECGCNLTEIPYYNRFYCENCGLHY